jgi:CheY-like chemotaxis protein
VSALILIVEDNPVSAKTLELNLAQHGYETMLAQTAREALECLEYAPNTHLIITDVMMPDMDGFEFLQTIKEHPLRKDIPVIMATSLADVDSIKRAFAMGCRSYIVKPIRAAQLLQKVHDVLDPEKPILRDQFHVMLELGLDVAAYGEIARAFAEQVSEKVGQLEGQLVGEYVEDLLPSLRDLSEGAALLGAERVMDIIEGAGIKGERMPDDSEQVDYPLILKELKLLQEALTLSASA